MIRITLLTILVALTSMAWSQEEVFTIVDESAKPIGGMETFYKYVQEHMKYPADARHKGIEGRVFVEFIIEPDGSLTNAKVIKGIGAGCDEEAVKTVANSGDWIPGTLDGKTVKQKIVLPITFQLGGGLEVIAADDGQESDYFLKLYSGKKVFGEFIKYKARTFGKAHFDVDGERFEADIVMAYQNQDGYFLKSTSENSYKPIFYHRETQGSRINTYSITSTNYSGGAPNAYGGGMGMGTWSTTKVGYYSKDEGALRKLNYKNLQRDLSDNLESAMKLKEVKKIRTAHTFIYLVGAALLIKGVSDTTGSTETTSSPQNDGPNVSPLVYVGAVTLWIPFLTNGGKRKKTDEAIRLYNK
jgi:TonB family protein